uniref:Uncharacterized protein n=1 Tax=Ditylenchus dipsaci TaxID=166011 RepID=A0A915E895_9BILA
MKLVAVFGNAGGTSPSSWISRIEGPNECSSRSSEIPSRSAGSPKKEKQSSGSPAQRSRHLSRQHRRQVAKWNAGLKEPPSLRQHHRHQSEGKRQRQVASPDFRSTLPSQSAPWILWLARSVQVVSSRQVPRLPDNSNQVDSKEVPEKAPEEIIEFRLICCTVPFRCLFGLGMNCIWRESAPPTLLLVHDSA